MKKILFSVLLLFGITVLNAQSLTDSNARFSASFGLMSAENSEDSDYGLQIGYLYSLNIAGNSMPLFLQFGPELNWMTYSENDARETIVNLASPINLAYRFGLSDNLSIEPFVGANVRVNLVGKLSYDGDELLDYFDDADANRFQMGINVGAGLNINNIYVGYRFNHDLMNYLSGISSKTNYHFFTVGINF